jgi:pyridoxine kinase
MKEPKKILLINDMAGYGKVALSAMIPILSHMKFQVYNLPTAVVSNTLDYGEFEILDTTEYMIKTIQVWEHLGFHFDLICTGFITSAEQVDVVLQYCQKQKQYGTRIVVDPIMGDDGKLYNGISESIVKCMQKLCAVADICVPNLTEAAFLSNTIREQKVYTKQKIADIISLLTALGCKSSIITSAVCDGKHYTVLKEEGMDEIVFLPYEEIPVRFPGTGDIFTAITAGEYLKGNTLKDAVSAAMNSIQQLIMKNIDNADKYKGIPIESYLADLSL